MSMVTRCPACGTVFRVGPQQLQAHQGLVRCGRCQHVFDGFKTLSTAPESGEEAPEAASAAAQPAAPGVAPPPASEAALPAADAPPAGPDVTPHAPAAPAEPVFTLEAVSATQLAAAAEPAVDSTARSAGAEEAPRDFGPAPEQLTIDDQLFLEESREARARSTRLWGIGAALLFVVLAGQALYAYRGELAAHSPALRPYLTRVCDVLRCAIVLPQQPRLIAIEASDLQAADPARPGVIQLTATVRNHAGFDVGYPALDLVLTNSRDHTLARRVFLPRDYLEPGRDAREGIPANAEVTIRLDLDTGDLNPAGFRLDLLAAPPPS
jgi:predicted Zn finger-like uncharacterized protein